MSILISCRNLSKSFSSRPLFEGLTLGLADNERTGLIGPNGAGKSTLLRILAGLEQPDSGEVSMRRGLRVLYLAQQDVFKQTTSDSTVRDELVHVLKDLHLEDYEVDMRIDSWVERAGFHLDQKIANLSGGWRKRLAILSTVICEPDLLLLDEPTNHLDLEGVLWLEKFLSSLEFSFLVITHDRRFLESTCNRVIEINKRYPEGHFSSRGNYSDFIEAREALFEAQASREESARNIVRREIEWLRKGPKARTTKQKARIDRAGELISELGELQYRNAQDRAVNIDFSNSERRTKKLIELIGVKKSMGGKKLFGPMDLMLGPGDKLGLLGGNGSGKSTFLKMLAGQLEPDAGTIKRADRLKVVMFDQHREQLNLDWPLRKALCENGEKVEYQGRFIHVAGWATRFLFTPDQLNIPLRRLSGGEQSRVLIARLMLREADILLLDEPTNDLDIASLEVLENSMMEFGGALVLVTHDRYLLDRVSKQLLSLDGKGNARFFADLSQWENAVEQEASGPAPVTKTSPAPEPAAMLGLSRKEQKELAALESKIQAAEKEKAAAEAALSDPGIAANAAELTARAKTLQEIESRLADLVAQWENLEARR